MYATEGKLIKILLQVMEGQLTACFFSRLWRLTNYIYMGVWHLASSGLILGLSPANERRRYFVTTSLIGSAQT